MKREAIKKWIWEHMHESIAETIKALNEKLTGHYRYYGIYGNYIGLQKYYKYVRQELWKSKRRRDQTCCREILDQLDKRKIRKLSPSFTDRLLFELLPLQTRPARELAMRVLEYGRCDWNEPDDRGVPLYKVIIQSGRAELAAKAAAGLRKKDAENPELAPVWAEPLYKVY